MQQVCAVSLVVIIQTSWCKIKQESKIDVLFLPDKKFYQTANSRRLSLSFLHLLKKNPTDNRSRVEIKPLTESPLAVNCTDRIRFNTTLDFLSPLRKVRNYCLAFLCHPFVSLEIKSKLVRYCVVKRHIKGSVLVATAVLKNNVERKQGARLYVALSCHLSSMLFLN